MPETRSDRTFFKRSLAISGGLHFALLPLLVSAVPAMLGFDVLATNGTFSTREATTVSYLTIERRPPQPRPAAAHPWNAGPRGAPAAEPVSRTAPVAVLPDSGAKRAPSAPASRVSHSHASTDPAHEVAFAGAVAVVHRRIDAPDAAVPDTAQRTAVAPPVPAAPTPSPSPSPAAADASSSRIVDVPVGGWGQNFEQPIVADDTELADLRARYHDAAHASIEVDDSGHATRVVLPAGLTEDQRADLERRLMALRYVPAECNGLHCAATLVLTL
jgi:hypothetical protein